MTQVQELLPVPGRQSAGRVLRVKKTSNQDDRFVRFLSETVLWVGSLLGTVALLITAAAAVYGVRPVIIKSGSMEPSIETGAVLLGRSVDARDLAVGDVVSVTRPDGVRVTHRIIEISTVGDQRGLVLKGDANEDADPHPVRVEHAYKVIAEVPKVGRVISYAATPLGGFALGITISAALLLPGRRRRAKAGR